MDLSPTSPDLQTGREALLAGDPRTAAAIFETQVAADPANPEARYWLASALMTAGDRQGAAGAMDDARILHALPLAAAQGVDLPRCKSDAVYGHEIALQFYRQSMVAMSGVVRALAMQAGGMEADGLFNYGLALQHQGRPEEASQVFRAMVDAFPELDIQQFVIYPQLFCDDGDARHAAEAREWIRRNAPAVDDGPLSNTDRAGRKLRIGYVAPSFATSQLRQFISPLLENHDPDVVSVTLYPAKAEPEEAWPDWIQVHPIGHLDDAAAAALIRRDGIDILADCWGHTAGGRLAIFARRAAPVQIGWLNFIQTTGLAQIDYIPHAGARAEPYMAANFVERIWPIGPVFNAFRPPPGRLEPVATPALRTGRITFGSFNYPAKLSDWTLDAWGAVLRGAPTSRLLLKYRYFDDPVLQRVTQARFAARGVEPERIVFAGHSKGEAYFQAFREVDLMLDAWPAPGSTTTLDTLSNGVPVLVMAGSTVGGAYARAILEGCGLPELVTDDPDAFVARALELTADPACLDALRARVRPAFDGGPCCDEVAFTRRVEGAFGDMFDLWRRQAHAERSAA